MRYSLTHSFIPHLFHVLFTCSVPPSLNHSILHFSILSCMLSFLPSIMHSFLHLVIQLFTPSFIRSVIFSFNPSINQWCIVSYIPSKLLSFLPTCGSWLVWPCAHSYLDSLLNPHQIFIRQEIACLHIPEFTSQVHSCGSSLSSHHYYSQFWYCLDHAHPDFLPLHLSFLARTE